MSAQMHFEAAASTTQVINLLQEHGIKVMQNLVLTRQCDDAACTLPCRMK